MIRLKRARDPAEKSDGSRYLVDRLWPRGVKKSDLHLDGWLKDVAPSAALRTWFAHDPSKWVDFQKRYWDELGAHAESWQPILDAARRGTVTLIYNARDVEHNNAIVLKMYLDQRLDRESKSGSR
jgi:uncharacterized protein YeaO (DUF488 family)